MWRTSALSIALISRSSRIDRKDPASWFFASSEAVEVAASPADSGFRPTRASNTLDKRANSHDGRLESRSHRESPKSIGPLAAKKSKPTFYQGSNAKNRPSIRRVPAGKRESTQPRRPKVYCRVSPYEASRLASPRGPLVHSINFLTD